MLQTLGSLGNHFSLSAFLLRYSLSENPPPASQRNNAELEEPPFAGPRRAVLRLRSIILHIHERLLQQILNYCREKVIPHIF